MTVGLVVLAAALLLALPATAWWLSRGQLRSRLRTRLVVTLKSGAAFDGLLYGADRSVWVLRNVQAIGAGDNGSTVPVDGEVLILAADIDYAQKP